jgi:hypothetical protein
VEHRNPAIDDNLCFRTAQGLSISSRRRLRDGFFQTAQALGLAIVAQHVTPFVALGGGLDGGVAVREEARRVALLDASLDETSGRTGSAEPVAPVPLPAINIL